MVCALNAFSNELWLANPVMLGKLTKNCTF
jgi:hypothetical protein